MAAKSKLTAKLQQEIVDAIRVGSTREAACANAGINSRTLRIWMQRAKAGEQPYQRFAEAVELADGESQQSLLLEIRRAAAGDWKAAAWLLERMYPKKFGYKAQVELTMDELTKWLCDVAEGVLGPDQAARLFDAITARRSEQEVDSPSGTEGLH
jgi:transposase